MPLSDLIQVNVDAPTIAGTSTIDSSIIDMAGFEGVLFVCRLGTPAANNNIRCQQGQVSNLADAADLQGTLVAAGANNLLVLDIFRPVERYVRCRVTRGTSTTIDAIVAIRYQGRQVFSWPSSTSFEAWVDPVEGAA